MQARKGIFFTGTDTGCGKTYVTNLVVRALRNARVDAVGYKPLCCGDRGDVENLRLASDELVSLDEINPIWLRTPAAPHVAAMFENQSIDLSLIQAGFQHLRSKSSLVIVEGVGGWQVPIRGMDYTVAHMARDLDLPVIVVVGNRLGALNHTILTIQSMRTFGIEPAGLVFNNLLDELDTATITNKGIIEDLMGVAVLTDVIRNQEEIEVEPFMDILRI
jgi:dethiobiotin synthetase